MWRKVSVKIEVFAIPKNNLLEQLKNLKNKGIIIKKLLKELKNKETHIANINKTRKHSCFVFSLLFNFCDHLSIFTTEL